MATRQTLFSHKNLVDPMDILSDFLLPDIIDFFNKFFALSLYPPFTFTSCA